MYALQWSAILTEPTVSKFPVAPQLFWNNCYTKFDENQTNGLVADTKWHTGDKITSPAPRITR